MVYFPPRKRKFFEHFANIFLEIYWARKPIIMDHYTSTKINFFQSLRACRTS